MNVRIKQQCIKNKRAYKLSPCRKFALFKYKNMCQITLPISNHTDFKHRMPRIKNIIRFVIEQTCTRKLCTQFTATLIMILRTQLVFNSCSFNYKSDYSIKIESFGILFEVDIFQMWKSWKLKLLLVPKTEMVESSVVLKHAYCTC